MPFLWLPGTAELSIVVSGERLPARRRVPRGALHARRDHGEGRGRGRGNRRGLRAPRREGEGRDRRRPVEGDEDGRRPLRRVHAQRRDLRRREEGRRGRGPPAVHAPARPPLPPPGRSRPRAGAAAGRDGLARARRAPPAPRRGGRRHRATRRGEQDRAGLRVAERRRRDQGEREAGRGRPPRCAPRLVGPRDGRERQRRERGAARGRPARDQGAGAQAEADDPVRRVQRRGARDVGLGRVRARAREGDGLRSPPS